MSRGGEGEREREGERGQRDRREGWKEYSHYAQLLSVGEVAFILM